MLISSTVSALPTPSQNSRVLKALLPRGLPTSVPASLAATVSFTRATGSDKSTL
jgi:hypothetical protein